MEDLSLHILDIAENAIGAHATVIEIILNEDTKQDLMTLEIADNGIGMDEETTKRVLDPFYTTRTTRRVGLGLPFLSEAAKAANGMLTIASRPGSGTRVKATFQRSHVDRQPVGNMADTIVTLIAGRPDLDIIYEHWIDGHVVSFNTKDVREVWGESIATPEILRFIRQYIEQAETSFDHQARDNHGRNHY